MSEWGRVALYYDYEIENIRGKRQRIRGLISKAYKYPGVEGMILHAYYGIGYFLALKDKEYNRLGGENWESRISGLAELNTAFDVLWDYGTVCPGIDDVRDELEKAEIDEDRLENNLFNCEGSDGWLFMKYTGNPEDGYSLKYGYFYGWGSSDSVEVGNIKRAMEITCIHHETTLEEEFGPNFDEIVEFFDKEATLMDEDEFWGVEDLGVEWLKEMRANEE